MVKKINLVVILLTLILLPLSNSLNVGIGNDLIGIDLIPTAPINYSLIPTVNNTEHFGGYTVTTFVTYLQGLYDLVYCKLTGCTMTGDIDMGGNDITGVSRIMNDYPIGGGYIDVSSDPILITGADLRIEGNTDLMASLYIDDDLIVDGNITGDWVNGQFNWTTGDTWNIFDGSTLTFNESKLATTYYNASTIQVVTGTPQGIIGDIQSYNSISYNVSEVASDLELRVNFTGIDDFNQLIVRYKSGEEDEPHNLQVQIYEPDEDEWEDYGALPESNTYHILEFGVFDSDEHIDALGVVQVRFYQDGGVPPKTHLHNFDWVAISKGFGTPSGEEADPEFNSWLMNPIFNYNINATNVNFTTTSIMTASGGVSTKSTFAITDPTFDTAGEWSVTGGFSITGGKATDPHLGGTFAPNPQLSAIIDRYYKITLDVDSIAGPSSPSFTFGGKKVSGLLAGANQTFWIKANTTEGFVLTSYSFFASSTTIDNLYIEEYAPFETGGITSSDIITKGQNVFTAGGTGQYALKLVRNDPNTPVLTMFDGATERFKINYLGDMYGRILFLGYPTYTTMMFSGATGMFDFINGHLELGADNQIIRFGLTNTDLQISSDGTNPRYNSTGVHTFYYKNGSLGTIRVGSVVYSSPENKDYDALSELVNPIELTTIGKSELEFHQSYPSVLQRVIKVTDENNCTGKGFERECGSKDELVIDASEWDMFNYKAIYELNEKVKKLESDNNLMKLSLCKLGEVQFCSE